MKLLQLFPRADYTIVGIKTETEKFALFPTRLTDGSVVWLEKVLYLLEGEVMYTNMGMDKIYYWNIKRKLRCKDEQANTTPSVSMQNETSEKVCMVSYCAGKQEVSFPNPFCPGGNCNLQCRQKDSDMEVD